MSLKNWSLGSSIAVLVLAIVALLGWWALGPLLRGLNHSEVLRVLPLEAVALSLIAAALLSCANGASPNWTRALAALALFFPAAVLTEMVLGLHGGVELLVVPGDAVRVGADVTDWRPGAQTSLTFLLLSLALWFAAAPREPRFDAADFAATAGLFVPFTAFLGHLFKAEALFGGSERSGAGMSFTMAALLTVLALGTLALKEEGGFFGAYARSSVGSAAARRLVPAVVLVPTLLGLLQMFAVENQWMGLSEALAVAVGANIMVYMILIRWVSALLSRLEAEQRGEMSEQVSQAQEQGMTDALTGLYNRRGWDQNLARVEERCKREKINACVVVIDLDGLKQVNDTLGHNEGDALIKRAAKALREAARSEDLLARLGGDEFAYLAIGCAPEHAPVVLKRLAQSLAKGQVKASLGHAMRDLNESLVAAFKEADHAMYGQKRARKAQAAARAVAQP